MPNLIIESSFQPSDAQANDGLIEANKQMLATGWFVEDEIKSRWRVADYALMGLASQGSFISIELQLMAGRDLTKVQDLAKAIVAAIRFRAPEGCQVTLLINEMSASRYIRSRDLD